MLKKEKIQAILNKQFHQLAEIPLQDAICQEGMIKHFKRGDVTQEIGSYVKFVPLISKGTLKVLREDDHGNEIFLYYLHAGDSCSMAFSCCMMHKKSEVRTKVVEDVELIGIPIRFVDEWMMKFHSWKNFVMKSYDSRMMELIQTIDEIAFLKMDERLLNYLNRKSKAIGDTTIFSTHQEIAQDLNASREAISRLLKKLEKQEILTIGRNKITLLVPTNGFSGQN
ncbi:MAG TPA: Crp/Fnr family transcriptional regulator [Saprospiraceae bacterium]|nr:Crp/Fnr family transcriptional regulator [Saprospiraceae bacterium]